VDRGRQHWRKTPAPLGLRCAGTLIRASAVYWLTIYPQIRQELREWEQQARTIPDPVLRGQALHKLTAERLNPEAAAFFAILAPRRTRSRVVRLIVAYQLLYDYLDAVNELSGCTDLENGLLLHRSLLDAVRQAPSACDYYKLNDTHDDGGYMCLLIDTCRTLVRTLESSARLEAVLCRAIARVGDAQSHNHAIASEGESGLIGWCLEQASGDTYLWWEIAAGGISCLGVHALFALAAQRDVTIQDALPVEAAYFPPICALSALLDSLSDHTADAGTANHSFTARYRDSNHAAERFVAIAKEAAELTERLDYPRRHTIILAGIVVFYLSSSSVREGFPVPVADRLSTSLGPVVRPMCMVMRLRRYLHARSDSPASE
jgi:tetraprenyl-beta-curcumene synthase